MAHKVPLPVDAWFPDTSIAPDEGWITVNNAPRPVLWFDGATDQQVVAHFTMPEFTGTLTLVLHLIAASATSGTCRFQATMQAVTPADALDLDAADSFATTNSAGASLPGTAGYLFSLSITLTNNDSVAAGDEVTLVLRRDADGTTGTDDVTTDVGLLSARVQDAA